MNLNTKNVEKFIDGLITYLSGMIILIFVC